MLAIWFKLVLLSIWIVEKNETKLRFGVMGFEIKCDTWNGTKIKSLSTYFIELKSHTCTCSLCQCKQTSVHRATKKRKKQKYSFRPMTRGKFNIHVVSICETIQSFSLYSSSAAHKTHGTFYPYLTLLTWIVCVCSVHWPTNCMPAFVVIWKKCIFTICFIFSFLLNFVCWIWKK